MIIGEAPAAEEDQRGEPFVGRAGKLLDQDDHRRRPDPTERSSPTPSSGGRPATARPRRRSRRSAPPSSTGRSRWFEAPSVLVLAGGASARVGAASGTKVLTLRGRWFDWAHGTHGAPSRRWPPASGLPCSGSRRPRRRHGPTLCVEARPRRRLGLGFRTTFQPGFARPRKQGRVKPRYGEPAIDRRAHRARSRSLRSADRGQNFPSPRLRKPAAPPPSPRPPRRPAPEAAVGGRRQGLYGRLRRPAPGRFRRRRDRRQGRIQSAC